MRTAESIAKKNETAKKIATLLAESGATFNDVSHILESVYKYLQISKEIITEDTSK